ncbi:hypothetical protein D9M69_492820 [compost metagenome]
MAQHMESAAMIDPTDTQTKALPLEDLPGNIRNEVDVTGMAEVSHHGVEFAQNPMTRKPRGRPATGKALSNADRQRAYRERQKAQRNEMERELHNAEATIRVDEGYSDGLWQELEQAKARIRELEEQLAQRNETPMKERPKEKLHGWVVQLKSMHMKHWKTITKRPWPTEEIALKRIEELKADHRTNEDMEYRAKKV